MVAKNDDEVYILIIIKIYSFHLFSLLCKRRSSCWKYRRWCSYFENLYHHAKIIENKLIGQSLFHFVVFHKRNYQVFWTSFRIRPLQLPDWLHCGCARTSALKYWIFACLSKMAIKTLTQNVKFAQTFFISHLAALLR